MFTTFLTSLWTIHEADEICNHQTVQTTGRGAYQVYGHSNGEEWLVNTFASLEEAEKVSYGWRTNGFETFVRKAD
jgi:hypothetical protein